MSAERIYADYLEDILDAMEKVVQFIEGMTFDQFAEDDKTVCVTRSDSHADKPSPRVL